MTGDQDPGSTKRSSKAAAQARYNPRVVWSWAMYDFANSAFTTLIVTFIYAFYFTQSIAENGTVGTTQWSWAVTITAIVVALASPVVGALADRGGTRKRFLFWTTAIAVLGSAVLFFPTEGQVVFALVTFTIANIAFELAGVFYNAYLPEIAPEEKIGRVSGYGWALGYVGGLLCMAIAFVGFVQTDTPWFGLSTETGAHARATNILVAVWFAAFSLPLLLFVPNPPPAAEASGRTVRAAFQELGKTIGEIRRYRQVFRMLLARLIYNDGLVTIFAFGGIYAGETFGFTLEEVILFGIALNVAAGVGAFLFGHIDDRIGGKRTIMISLAGLIVASAMAVFAQTRTMLWVAGILTGLLIGPNQSASRSLLGRFVPPDKETEFYGFFAFSGKATAFLGPFLLGHLTGIFDSQRVGVSVVILFFAAGALLLARVNEQEGMAASGRSGKPEIPPDGPPHYEPGAGGTAS